MSRKQDNAAKDTADPHICPNDGATMLARPLPEPREIKRTMIEQGSPHYYADSFAEKVHEKQEAAGVLYVCPMCKYQNRIKDAA